MHDLSMAEVLCHSLGCHVDGNCCPNGGIVELTTDELLKECPRRRQSGIVAPPQHEPGDDVPPVGIFFTSLCSDVTAEAVVHGGVIQQ